MLFCRCNLHVDLSRASRLSHANLRCFNQLKLGIDHFIVVFRAIKEGDRKVDEIFRPETIPQPKTEAPKNVGQSTLNEKLGTPRSQQQEPEAEPARKPTAQKDKAPKQEPAGEPLPEKTQPAQQGPSPREKFVTMLEKCTTVKDVKALRLSFLGPSSAYDLSQDDKEFIQDKGDSVIMVMEAEGK